MSQLILEKMDQAIEILKEKQIDLWLVFVRETMAGGDPVLPLIYGHDLTWQSNLIFTRTGERIAVVGRFEAETARRDGGYTQVIPYDQSIRDELVNILEKINPSNIAINYSINDVQADGLTHGLYQVLRGIWRLLHSSTGSSLQRILSQPFADEKPQPNWLVFGLPLS